MTASSVKLAVQSFLQTADTPGLNVINRAPVMVADPALTLPDGASFGATSYIWLELDKETVISVGGAPSVNPNGWRMVEYNAALIFDWYVLQAAASDDTWVDALDAMTDSVKVALRSDPTLGTAGVGALTIFSAADEFPGDAPSISVVLQEPKKIPKSSAFLVHGAVVFPIRDTVPPG